MTTVREPFPLCGGCGKTLEEIGVPPAIRAVEVFKQAYKKVVDIGDQPVPEEIKKDPFLYRGFYCPACKKAFCPTCCHMQGEICPQCNQRKLMPAYRPLLRTAETGSGAPPVAGGGGPVAAEKSPSPAKAGPEGGYCPHCGAFLLDKTGARIRLFIKDTGEQGIGCPKCPGEFDSGILAALRQAHTSMSFEQITERLAAGRSEPAKKGACFVASAAFGSAMQPEVQCLRRFRDERLARHATGVLFIRFYNTVGPPLAGIVGSSPKLRRIARGAIRVACRVLQHFEP